jgi:acyl-CoA thioester hydrolase
MIVKIALTSMTNFAHTADALQQSPAPFVTTVMQIEPQWIDFNGHLNMAYYNVLFDHGIDQMWAQLGIGPGYIAERGGSTFTAECHIRYLREVHLGDPVQVAVFILGHDEKRIHTFEELRHATEGWVSATSENISLHVNMATRKTAPFPADISSGISLVCQAHSAVPRPNGIGRHVSMPANSGRRV